MKDFHFFLDERIVDSFALPLHKGRAKLTWVKAERWEEQFSRSLSCGTEHKRTLTRRTGMSATEREDLEATIKTSLGLRGLVELKSEVKGKVAREIRFDVSEEESDEFTFKAPKCGRLAIRLFQLRYVHKLFYEDSRFWHRAQFGMTVTEWVDRIKEDRWTIKNDPACDCDPKPETGIEGRVDLVFDKIGMTAGYVQGNSVEFPDLGMSFSKDSIEELLFTEIAVDRKFIPPHLLFLAGEKALKLKGRVLPHVEEGVIGVYPEHDWPYGRTKDFTQTSAVSEPRERLLSWYGSPTALFLVGGAIGAVLGWLFAPRSGGETREYVSQKPKEKPKDRLAVKLPEGRKDLHTKKIAEQQKNSLERSVQKVSQES